MLLTEYYTHSLPLTITLHLLQWVDAREKFEAAANLIDAAHRMRKSMWGQFWSAHQRFFKYLCISAKVQHCVQLAHEAVRSGKVCLCHLYILIIMMVLMILQTLKLRRCQQS